MAACCDDRSAVALHRGRRARPGARRRAGARGGRAARRRARGRQVHAAARGRRAGGARGPARRSTSPARSRRPRCACGPSASAPLDPTLYLAAETDLAAVLGHVDAVTPRPARRRLGADDRHRARSTASPGGVTQVREVAAALIRGGQGARHRHRPRRARDQGRLDRRAARCSSTSSTSCCTSRATATRGCGWCGRSRTGTARPTRSAASSWATTASPGCPTRAGCSCPTRTGAGAGHLRHGHPRGPPAAGRRGAGAGRRRPLPAPAPGRPRGLDSRAGRDGARRARQRRGRVRARPRPRSTPPPSAASGSPSRRPTSRVALAVASAASDLAAAARPGRARRGRPGRRGPPGPGGRPPARRGRPARLHPRARAGRTPGPLPDGMRARRGRATLATALRPWQRAGPRSAIAARLAHDLRPTVRARSTSSVDERADAVRAPTSVDADSLRADPRRGRTGHRAARRPRTHPARPHRRADRPRLRQDRRVAVHRRLRARRRVLAPPGCASWPRWTARSSSTATARASCAPTSSWCPTRRSRPRSPAPGTAPPSGSPSRPATRSSRSASRCSIIALYVGGRRYVLEDSADDPVPGQPGAGHARALQAAPRRGVRHAVRARDRGPRHRPRRRRRRPAAGDGAPDRRRDRGLRRRARHRRPAARRCSSTS